MNMTDFAYVGTELDLFAAAKNWKSYLRRQIAPFLGPEVLEVGAGLGGSTQVLCQGEQTRWVCLEPDSRLAERLGQSLGEGKLPSCCEVVTGTLEQGSAQGEFDTILYIDVLEHIEDDRAEAKRAAALVRQGGYLVALSPAHQWLYTPFDQSIGHYRRYTRSSMATISPQGLTLVRNVYLDSVGLLASLGNKLLLRSASPTPKQIALWDRVMVRTSRLIDPLLGYRLGKSVLAVWRK